MADDLDDVIQDNAQGPQRVSGDSGSMEQHPLKDQVEADRYLQSKKASRKKSLGLRIAKIVPPGAE